MSKIPVTPELRTDVDAGGGGGSVGDNEVVLRGGSGHGGTNTRIRRFTTIEENVGTAMTITQSAADGDSITINEDGIYIISYTDFGVGSTRFGISKNSSQLTTNIQSIAVDDVLSYTQEQANSVDAISVTTRLVIGDIIRAHTDVTPDGALAQAIKFRIIKVAN